MSWSRTMQGHPSLALGLARRHEQDSRGGSREVRKLDICSGACVIETSNHCPLA